MEDQLKKFLGETGCAFYLFHRERSEEWLREQDEGGSSAQPTQSKEIADKLGTYSLLMFNLDEEEYTRICRDVEAWNQYYPQAPISFRVENYNSDNCLVFGEYEDDEPFINDNADADVDTFSEMSTDDDDSDDADDADGADDADAANTTDTTTWARALIDPTQLDSELDPLGVIYVKK